MKEQDKENLEKYMIDEYGLHADGDSLMHDAEGVLQWCLSKIQKESPDAHHDISTIEHAISILDSIQNADLYDIE